MGKLLGSGPLCDAECNNLSCCTSTQRVVDPRWPCPERVRQISDAGDDSSFEFDVGETIHLQAGARLSVLKFRVARFKLTDVDGNVVNTRGTSVSFAIFLDYEQ